MEDKMILWELLYYLRRGQAGTNRILSKQDTGRNDHINYNKRLDERPESGYIQI